MKRGAASEMNTQVDEEEEEEEEVGKMEDNCLFVLRR